MPQMPASRDIRLFAVVAGAVFVADIITKQIMLAMIFDPPRAIAILPILNFAPAWNEGISFGLLADYGQLTRHGISALAVVVSFWLFFQLPELLKWQKIGAACIAGGALGNALDRQIYGKVVDFIDFHFGAWHYPAFNIADSAIFIGVGFWILAIIRGHKVNQDHHGA